MLFENQSSVAAGWEQRPLPLTHKDRVVSIETSLTIALNSQGGTNSLQKRSLNEFAPSNTKNSDF